MNLHGDKILMGFEQHPASICTHKGTLYIDRSNKKIKRTMTDFNAEFVETEVFKTGAAIGFWPKVTRSCDKFFDVEYVEHPIMWSDMTNKQILGAYLRLCDMLEYLNEYGYTIDSHLWNVVLSNSVYKLIDVGDFCKFDRNVQATTLKLCLQKHEHDDKSYKLGSWTKTPQKIIEAIDKHQSIDEVRQALKESGFVGNTPDPTWDRYAPAYNSFTNLSLSHDNPKDNPLRRWINSIKPETLTDLGCNTGKHTLSTAKELRIKCVGIDYAANTIDEAVENARSMGLACGFAKVDLLNPATVGLYDPPAKRLWSEMVIAPALVHHLFRACKDIKLAVDTIAAYGSKYAAIEFIPCTDVHINCNIQDWFSLDDIKRKLWNRGFTSIKVEPSFPKGRKWIFAEKNTSNQNHL